MSKIIAEKCFDVVVAGGGTGGIIAAIAAARQGARTALIEGKGYVGGLVVEGGVALHSFFNNWKPYPDRVKAQVVKGIPQELIDRLIEKGGCPGHLEMETNYRYESACTLVDTEIFKLVAMEMLLDEGVKVYLNTMLTDAVSENGKVKYVYVNTHAGKMQFNAKSFIDFTGYGDLCAYAGAEYTEPNDYKVANSIGVGGVNVEKYYEFFKDNDAKVIDIVYGPRDGKQNQLVRVNGIGLKNKEFSDEANDIILHTIITTLHDNYFTFMKLNYKMDNVQTDVDSMTAAELELRKRQLKAVEMLKKHVPGCENAFIARTSPSICIRRARCIACDYDITNEDVCSGRHFSDDVLTYGFHDESPLYTINNGGTYGIPYRALLVKGFDNLYAGGMMITSNFHAHMSTRNTVSCMAQGQAAGTASALCALNNLGSRELDYSTLRSALVTDGVYLEDYVG